MGLGRRYLPLGALALASMLAACSAGPSPNGTSSTRVTGPRGGEGLTGVTWFLTAAAVDSVDLSHGGITIEFTDTVAGGSTGLNRYTATFASSHAGHMEFGEVATTAMAGAEAVMAAERAYVAVLGTVTGYSVTGAELQLYADQQEMLTYAKG